MDSKPSQFKITPRGTARIIFYLLMSPFIYQEAGITLTVLIGILFVEAGMKGDWLNTMHTLQMALSGKVSALYDFQNNCPYHEERRNASKENTDWGAIHDEE